jgi:mono/diheme cytochrome c family protein
MYDQPRYEAYEASETFDDGASSRTPVAGTVARGELRADELLYTGRVGGKLADEFPFPIDRAALRRGRERYSIYCTPCHGEQGDGRGMIVLRGFSPPPPFYGKREEKAPSSTPVTLYADLRDAPVGHFFDVMTHGHGAMYSYAARIPVEDRWRIAAYIRALQLSRYAPADDLKRFEGLTADERRFLQEAGR